MLYTETSAYNNEVSNEVIKGFSNLTLNGDDRTTSFQSEEQSPLQKSKQKTGIKVGNNPGNHNNPCITQSDSSRISFSQEERFIRPEVIEKCANEEKSLDNISQSIQTE